MKIQRLKTRNNYYPLGSNYQLCTANNAEQNINKNNSPHKAETNNTLTGTHISSAHEDPIKLLYSILQSAENL